VTANARDTRHPCGFWPPDGEKLPIRSWTVCARGTAAGAPDISMQMGAQAAPDGKGGDMTNTSLNPAAPHLDPEDFEARPTTPNDHLRDLHTRIVDAKAGFDVMVDKAEPAFRDVAVSFRDMHAAHAEKIAIMLHGHVEPDGSLMATVNKAVVSLRAFFDEIDADVMEQVRRGEDHVLAAFREAEANCSAPQEVELIAMRAELENLLKRTAHLD